MKVWVARESETEDNQWKTNIPYVFQNKKDAQEWLADCIDNCITMTEKCTEFRNPETGELYAILGHTKWSSEREEIQMFCSIEEYEILTESHRDYELRLKQERNKDALAI